ncbi:TPM domain-containing protein [Paludisphaera sp.]|uniref:TPM domain-containing protein n=1 Tax=Paludisphaera sp. TaxID=2017432 RepID=UPI00301BE626
MIATIPRAVLALSIALIGAAPPSPMPEFTGARLYVVDVPDRYQAVERAIRELEADSPRSYYVAVVKTAGGEPHAARDYAERLRESWREGAGFDADSSVIVVAALDDRQVAVLPSRALVDGAGLSSGYVEREVIRPRFVPLARDGDYPGALVALLEGVEARAASFETTGAEPAREVATTAAPMPATPASGTTGTSVAWSIVAVAGVLAGMVALLVWLGRRRAQGAFRARLKEYKTKAVAMMDRLDALKARLKALPIEDGDFVEPMTGDTLALFERTQDELRKLWDRWLEVMDVVDRAERHGEKGAKGVKAGGELVSDAKVFEEVEAGAVAASEMMDRLNAAHEDARAAAATVEESLARTARRIEAVGAAGLPVAPYRPEADRIAEQARQADAILVSDPLGARAMLDQAASDSETLATRAGGVLARREEGAEVEAGLAKLRRDVTERRGDGLRLDEDGGNPDDPAARADQALADLQSALEEGDPVAGATSLASARAALDQGRGVLDSVVRARDVVAKGLPESRRESRRLVEAVKQYAAFEDEMRRDFAPESWRDVAGHMTQARALLETFDRKADEVEREADARSQKFLLASRLLGRLNQEQRAAFQLMNGVGERLTALKGVRDQARRLVDELTGLDREVRDFFRRNDAAVGGQARASFQAAAGAREEAARAASGSRPDWPSALKALTKAREEYGIARAQAQSDVDVHRVLTSEYDEARRYAARVEGLLAGQSEDRAAANRRFQQAARALELVGGEGARAGAEWPLLLERVRDARRDLEQSERLAREDVRLARDAESEIAEAARTIREGRAFLSMGVGMDVSPAEALLDQAQALYRSQDYERAAQAAASALQHVRQAHEWAVQQAHSRRIHAEAEQRRRAVAAQNFGMGAAVGAGGAMPGGSAALAEPGPGHAPAPARAEPVPPAPPAASGSWESNAAEGSW